MDGFPLEVGRDKLTETGMAKDGGWSIPIPEEASASADRIGEIFGGEGRKGERRYLFFIFGKL